MAQDQCTRCNLADQFQQGFSVCVRREVKVAHVAALGQFAGAVAVMKFFSDLCRLEAAAGSIGIGIADEEYTVGGLVDHATG